VDLTNLSNLSPDDLVDLYDNDMTLLLDKRCLKVTLRRKRSKLTPWFDSNCRASRTRVRAAERHFQRTRKDADKTVWVTRLESVRALYEQKNKLHWRAEIDDSKL